MQADPPFLVASSGGEIAKTINRITRLEEVDDWVAELTSEINSGNRDVVRNEEDAKRLLQDISVFKDIDETEAIINELKVVSGLISKLSNERYDLDRMLIQYENSVREYEKLDKYFLAEKYVLKAEKIQSEIDDFYFLKNLIEEYDSLTESIKAKEILNQVEGLIKEIEAYYKMKDLLYVYENNDKEYQKTYDELEEAKLKYIEIISKIGKCPVCFAPMSSKHLKEIERSL
jgi:tetratricopeptide (TPR) repeat protein